MTESLGVLEIVSSLDNWTHEKTEVFMDEKEYILSDEHIRSLTDTTPLSEGDTVGFLEDGDGYGFWLAAEEVAVASAVQAAKLTTGQARALFHMRSFYFLGVLRGAEEYRYSLTDKFELKTIPFSLDDCCSQEFRESLEEMKPEEFQRLCALLGLSVPWENGKRLPI